MQHVLDLIKSRRSIRKFKSDAVPSDLVDKVVEAGLYAATGKNRQPCKIIVITNEDLKAQIRALNAQIMGSKEGFDPFYGAPVYILVVADKSAPTATYDGSLVLGNMMLAAHALGLGSCWIHRAKESMETPLYKDLFKSLGIEGDFEGIGHLALGYVLGDYPECPKRKENSVYYVK